MRRLFAVIAPISLARAALGQSQPVTSKDSAVAAVRAVYQEVETAIKDKRLVQHDTTLNCVTDEREFEGDFTIWRDSAGVVRRFDMGRWGARAPFD